jgi:hypothetical protein
MSINELEDETEDIFLNVHQQQQEEILYSESLLLESASVSSSESEQPPLANNRRPTMTYMEQASVETVLQQEKSDNLSTKVMQSTGNNCLEPTCSITEEPSVELLTPRDATDATHRPSLHASTYLQQASQLAFFQSFADTAENNDEAQLPDTGATVNETPPLLFIREETILSILKHYRIVSDGFSSSDPAVLLHAIFEGFSAPALTLEMAQQVLLASHQNKNNNTTLLPEQPVLVSTRRIQMLLAAGYPDAPALLRMPVEFVAAFWQVLIQCITHETHEAYFVNCCFQQSTNQTSLVPTLPSSDWTYSARRFQQGFQTNAATFLWNMWDHAGTAHWSVVAPLARMLGLVSGDNPAFLRCMLTCGGGGAKHPLARMAMIRALTWAATSNCDRPFMYMFGGTTAQTGTGNGGGIQRSLTGLSAWPFRHHVAMAVWVRVERLQQQQPITLLSLRTDNTGGAGLQVLLVPEQTSCACAVRISIFDSNDDDSNSNAATHSLDVAGCVLVPRVWYHLAVRHTRSRMQGVFSLAPRQQVSVFLDGKLILTEALPFPNMADVAMGPLRRNHTRVNMTIKFGEYLDGQTGALYVFHDHVSDASFRALYEATQGSNKFLNKRSSSGGDTWDSRRSDIVKKSRVLDVNMTNDDADEIVLSHRRHSGSLAKSLDDKVSAVLDIGEADDDDACHLPSGLQKAVFGSKVFLVWDPRRSVDGLSIDIHLGAHISLDSVVACSTSGAQDTIKSIGGVQALIPVFRSLLVGEPDREMPISELDVGVNNEKIPFSPLPDLFMLLAAFVQDHNDNARELLRCGGVDVIEQLVYANRKVVRGRSFSALNSESGQAYALVEALRVLRTACSHYVGLETKVFSRLLFNIPLWLSGFPAVGISLHSVLLPALSVYTKMAAEKVRDCVGVRDMVHALRENIENAMLVNDTNVNVDLEPQLVCDRTEACAVLLGMIFEVLSCGVTPTDLAPFLNYLGGNLEAERAGSTGGDPAKLSLSPFEKERKHFTIMASGAFFLFLQIRPPVPGLYESFAHCCGSVQAGIGWIMCAMVNSFDDNVRSYGIRAAAAYLEITSRGPDSPLELASAAQASETDSLKITDVPSQVRATIAKGIAAMGPGVRSIVVPPSKRLTPRVVFKLMWNILRSHRSCLGSMTRAALVAWISDDNGYYHSELSSVRNLRSNLIIRSNTKQPGFRFDLEWSKNILAETGNTIGRSLHNPLAISTVLRLIRFLDGPLQDEWLLIILSLAKASRKSISLLTSVPDWQPCLFSLVSSGLETLYHTDDTSDNKDLKASATEVETPDVDLNDQVVILHDLISVQKRVDICLELYAVLLGHLIREGGDKVRFW